MDVARQNDDVIDLIAVQKLTKPCNICGDIKILSMFYSGLNHCKACYYEKQKNRRNSNVNAFLMTLLCRARGSANKRLSSGRHDAGMFSITLQDLTEVLAEQDGKC